MKKLLLGLLFLTFSGILMAQSTAAEQKVLDKADRLAEKLQLDEAQKAKLYRIQLRRFSDREVIAPNKASDQSLYLQQLKTIERGANFSIELMLREDQLPAFRAYTIDQRTRRAEVAQPMLKQGIPIHEVEIAMYELE